MTQPNIKTLYEIVVNEYVSLFCKKQSLSLDFWIGDCIGQIAQFGDYFFNFDDIRYDIDNNIRTGKILKWQSEGVEYSIGREIPQNINYESYCKGLRYKDLNKKRRMSKEKKKELYDLNEQINILKEQINEQALNK